MRTILTLALVVAWTPAVMGQTVTKLLGTWEGRVSHQALLWLCRSRVVHYGLGGPVEQAQWRQAAVLPKETSATLSPELAMGRGKVEVLQQPCSDSLYTGLLLVSNADPGRPDTFAVKITAAYETAARAGKEPSAPAETAEEDDAEETAAEKDSGEGTADGLKIALTYKGKPRTNAWVDRILRLYGDKIAKVEGKYYLLKFNPADVDWRDKLRVEDYGLIKGRVKEIIGANDILLRMYFYEPGDIPEAKYVRAGVSKARMPAVKGTEWGLGVDMAKKKVTPKRPAPWRDGDLLDEEGKPRGQLVRITLPGSVTLRVGEEWEGPVAGVTTCTHTLRKSGREKLITHDEGASRREETTVEDGVKSERSVTAKEAEDHKTTVQRIVEKDVALVHCVPILGMKADLTREDIIEALKQGLDLPQVK